MNGPMHICLICNGTGKNSDGKPCGLCSIKWNSTRITCREQLHKLLDTARVVRHDYLKFGEFEKGWDLESDQKEGNLTEVGKPQDLRTILTNIQNQLVSIASRNAEQRAEYHKIAGVLEKHRETKDIAKFITDSYQRLRRSWLLIEETERKVSDKLEALQKS